ncbi:MAG: hypothetical protein PHY31_07580 [Smithellaceae bacterium]|nr:hypothetical protein [Smithellaceae bacterium]
MTCLVCLAAGVLLACAHGFTPPPEAKPATVPQAIAPEVAPEQTPTDAELIYEGMLALGQDGQPPDYGRARKAFDAIIKDHPNSRWKKLAERLVGLLNDISDCRRLADKLKAQQTDLAQENDQLKKDIRLQNEKLQAALTDIERLKNIEIELEKRDRLLR